MSVLKFYFKIPFYSQWLMQDSYTSLKGHDAYSDPTNDGSLILDYTSPTRNVTPAVRTTIVHLQG